MSTGDGNGAGQPDSQVVPAQGEVVDESRELVDRAREVEADIIRGCRAIRTAGMFLAGRLCEFQEGRMWEALGYEIQEEWLAGPEIELGRTQVLKLVRVYRGYVLERNVQLTELEGVDPDKLDFALPAVKAGKVAWQDAVADAKTLGQRDMKERYAKGRDPNAPLNAEDEPERRQCPTCKTWVRVEKIEDEAA